MDYYSNQISRLIEEFSRLPGIGNKSAQRLAFHVINMPVEQVEGLANAIVDARKNVRYCKECCTLTDKDICPICSNPDRDHKTIMVVETPRDLAAYEKTVSYCQEKGLVVIGDIKRGDIGSTSAAYAVGHLGKVKVGNNSFAGFDEDFVTVNPYLGTDGVKPFVDVCKEQKKGLFILVKTSNPSSGEFQDRVIDGRPLYELVGEKVAQWGDELMGDEYSYVGAVVGATYPEMGKVLRKIMPKTFILVPGYGAQGGKGADLVHFFNEDGLGAIVNSSRGIIAAYKQEAYEKYKEFGAENYADASRAAVKDMIADISGALENR